MNTDFDIAIIGGGPNGAVAAALLAQHSGTAPARIVLIAPELLPAAGGSLLSPAAPELRVAAISRASEQLLRNAGAWEELAQERLCAYECMRVWHESAPADGPETLVFSAAELAEPNLGYIVENRALAMAGLASFRARGGHVIAVATEGDEQIKQSAHDVLYIPEIPEPLSPILAAIPLQLMAYYAALARGHDVDKPRNLAKSVTVE